MKTTRWLLAGALLAVGGWVAATGPSARAQDDASRMAEIEESQSIRAAVDSTQSVAVTMAVQDFTGPLEQKAISAKLASTLEELVRQRLDYSLGTYKPISVLVLYEDPTGKSQVRMAIGVTVPDKLRVKPPLRLERSSFPKAVRLVHKGPQEQLGRVYRAIDQTLKARTPGKGAGFPVVMQILDDPARVSQDQLRTVLNVPVK